MTGPKMDRFLIAAPENVAQKLKGILAGAAIEPQAMVYSGGEAIAACAQGGALLLTTYCLPDMSGEVLADRLGEDTDVLMIVPQNYDAPLPDRVLELRNPISQDSLVQAVRTMVHCRARMAELRKKTERLSRTLEERKIVERAKGRLMDALHMNEAQAHHHIQKKSMDSGCRIVEVAREIIEAETIAE